MKIGIEAQRIFRTHKHGMEVVALELIRQIQQLDSANEYLLFARNGPDRGCIQNSANFATKIVGGLTYADWEQASLPKAIKKEKVSLIHCTANTAPLRPGAPLLLTLHDVIFLEQVSFKGSAYQNFGNLYRRAVVPKAVKNAEHIITVSTAEKQAIIETCHVPAGKITVVYNGVGERFHNHYSAGDVEAFRKQSRLPRQFVLFHGNTAPKKNTERVIKAFVQYCYQSPQPLTMVITDFPPDAVYKILKAIGKRAEMGRFIFTGYVPSMQMPLLYNCASMFLYPSLRESFGLPILEAMACGVPVVTSNTSAMKEVAGDAALLVDPEQTEHIAAALVGFHENIHRRSEYIKKGFERAAKFNWRNSATQLLKLYESFT